MNHHWSISECPSLCRHRPGHSKGQTQSCTKWKTKKNYIHKHGRFWSISIRQKVEGKHLFSEVIFFIMDNMITILFLLTFKAINLTEQRWGVLIKLHNIYLSISNTHTNIFGHFSGFMEIVPAIIAFSGHLFRCNLDSLFSFS